jgi:hypothetical protein
MFKTRIVVPAVAAACCFLWLGTIPRVTAAQKVDKSAPKNERNLLLGEQDVKDLLLLMDTDKNGKISKKEFTDFMSAEFDRLDKDKSGELDPKELTQSRIRASRPAVGK